MKHLYTNKLWKCNRWGFRFLIFSALIVSTFLYTQESLLSTKSGSSTYSGISVNAGELFELTAPLDIPLDVRSSFSLYMETLKTGAPLPFPFSLEGYTLKDNSITISGRCLAGGMYEIPLGVFCYGDKLFFLPSWNVTVNEINPVIVRAKDMLYPYPEKILAISAHNCRYQELINYQTFVNGAAYLKARHFIQLGLWLFALIIAGLPIFYYGIKLFFASKIALVTQRKLSPQQEFKQLEKMYAIGEGSWTMLLRFLNGQSSPDEAKTSFELEKIYHSQGESELEKVCALIEEHGYLPGGEEQMNKAFNILKDRFC